MACGVDLLRSAFVAWHETRGVSAFFSVSTLSIGCDDLDAFGKERFCHLYFLADAFLADKQFKKAAEYFVRALRHKECLQDYTEAWEYLYDVASAANRDLEEILAGETPEDAVFEALDKQEKSAEKATKWLIEHATQHTKVHCAFEDAVIYCSGRIRMLTGSSAVTEHLLHVALFWAQAGFAYGTKQRLFDTNPERSCHGICFTDISGLLSGAGDVGSAATLSPEVLEVLHEAVAHVVRYADSPAAALEEICREPIWMITDVRAPMDILYDVYRQNDATGSSRRIFPCFDAKITSIKTLSEFHITETTSFRQCLQSPEQHVFDKPIEADEGMIVAELSDGCFAIRGGAPSLTSAQHQPSTMISHNGMIHEHWYLDCGEECVDVLTSDSIVTPPPTPAALCRSCKRGGVWKPFVSNSTMLSRISSSAGLAARKFCCVAPEKITFTCTTQQQLPAQSAAESPTTTSTEIRKSFVMSAVKGGELPVSLSEGRVIRLRYTFNHVAWQFCGSFLAATPRYYAHIMQKDSRDTMISSFLLNSVLDSAYQAVMQYVHTLDDEKTIEHSLLLCQWLEKADDDMRRCYVTSVVTPTAIAVSDLKEFLTMTKGPRLSILRAAIASFPRASEHTALLMSMLTETT